MLYLLHILKNAFKSLGSAMSDNHETFATKVKQLRIQFGLTQKELSSALGVSFATVNRWENAKTNPSKLAQNQFEQFCLNKEKGNR